MGPEETLRRRLEAVAAQGLRRSLCARRGVDFASNDYLGFSEDLALRARWLGALREAPTGAAGSRLLRGTLPLHEAVEAALADFCGREAALLFPSGYQANVGLMSALLTAEDQVFSDAANHASLIDGMRLGRADRHVFPHNDVAALEGLLRTSPRPRGARFIVTESLFSMDGDMAPLAALVEVARAHGAALIVDESHATGLYGDLAAGRGGGLVQAAGLSQGVFATVHTGGKALGVGGAWVAGPLILREYLVNFCRPFIFSTAALPAMAVALDAALGHWREVGPRRASRVRARAVALARALDAEAPGFRRGPVAEDASPIVPVVIGGNAAAVAVAERLQAEGFDVRAVRPPTVPPGTARLRVTVTSDVPDDEWRRFLERLPAALCEHGRA
jgi:8-amino-7-oxononanoate synthase